MANLDNLKPFTKGDPRINRRGRIDNFAKLRKLAQKIGNDATEEDEILFASILKSLAKSKNPQAKALFLAYAVGRPKEEVDVTSEGKSLVIKIVKASDDRSTDQDK
jgi:hypothetical protein